METKLPVLISIPHGGLSVPEELADRISPHITEILGDSDAFTRDIYDLGERAAAVAAADIARSLVDCNRSPASRPPEKEDGVIKDVTNYGVKIYRRGQEPDGKLIDSLIKRYYDPYHRRIRDLLEMEGLVLGLDCHSMAAVGPPLAKDPGQRRPLICLGNCRGKTCSEEKARELAHCFQEAFGLSEKEVLINEPYSGGHITRTYGGNPIPWVQVEMSRAMYLEHPWFDVTNLSVDRGRLAELKGMFERALSLFFGFSA